MNIEEKIKTEGIQNVIGYLHNEISQQKKDIALLTKKVSEISEKCNLNEIALLLEANNTRLESFAASIASLTQQVISNQTAIQNVKDYFNEQFQKTNDNMKQIERRLDAFENLNKLFNLKLSEDMHKSFQEYQSQIQIELNEFKKQASLTHHLDNNLDNHSAELPNVNNLYKKRDSHVTPRKTTKISQYAQHTPRKISSKLNSSSSIQSDDMPNSKEIEELMKEINNIKEICQKQGDDFRLMKRKQAQNLLVNENSLTPAQILEQMKQIQLQFRKDIHKTNEKFQNYVTHDELIGVLQNYSQHYDMQTPKKSAYYQYIDGQNLKSPTAHQTKVIPYSGTSPLLHSRNKL